jgi:hypothetical protein
MNDEWKEDYCPECGEECYSQYDRYLSDKWTDVVQYDCQVCGLFDRSHDSNALDRAIEARGEDY